ncbi:MAG: AraC family transcriptional regulator [Tissierellales bacterium]
MLRLDDLLYKKLPDEYTADLKIYANSNLSIAKPEKFVANIEICFDNYYFFIPTATPPPTKICKKVYEFKANRAIALNPEQSILLTEDVPTKEYTSIIINKKLVQEVAYQTCGREEVQFITDSYAISRRLKSFFDDFVYEATNAHSSYSLMLDSISIQIVIQLLREINSNIFNKISCKAYSDKSHIIKAIDFIEEYYNSNISIEDLCKVSNLSPYHFIRLFKAKTGRTPHNYILDKKIEEAIKIIKSKDYSLIEVAQICGFISQSHFSTVFKKRVGISPSSYKKQL